MFFGKHFASMYGRSMVGSGAIVFAVWGYVIACQKPDKKVGSMVEINPTILAAILGESQEDIEKAIEFLCAPDNGSTTKKEQGKRLIRLGQFDYQVVNGAKYLAIRDEETRRDQNREAQRRKRSKNEPFGLPGEATSVRLSQETGVVVMPVEYETGKNGAALDPNASRSVEPQEDGESDSGL